MIELDEADGQDLLRLARQAIVCAFEGREPDVEGSDLRASLRAGAAAFVTITRDGELRGCIGRLDRDQPVWRNVVAAAVSAAFGDPRFGPLRAQELPLVRLEVTVLDEAVVLDDPRAFDPAREGVMIDAGPWRGLLLPQVARERGWDAETTLEAACWKAGLPGQAWRLPGVRVSAFGARSFEEPAAGPARPAGAEPPPVQSRQ